MERGYLFNSMNLGQAFAKELEELGYEYRDRGSWGWYSDLVSGGNLKPESLHLDPNEKLSVHNHQKFPDIKTFDLEKEWVEALSDAKKKTKNKKRSLVGYWITRPDSNSVIFAKKLYDNGNGIEGYGFAMGRWCEDDIWPNYNDDDKSCRATEEEIIKVFLREVNRRYNHGDLVKLENGSTCKINTHLPYQIQKNGREFIWGGCKIFSKGKWRERKLPNLKFFEHKVETIDPLTFKIGCTVREKFYLRKVLKDLRSFPEQKVQDVIKQLEKILN